MDLDNNFVSVNSRLPKPQIPILQSLIKLKIKCKICKKPFMKELLKKHMRISHSNVKIPVKKVNKAKLLKKAKLPCMKSRKFTCEVCKKHFTTQTNLNAHMHNTHGSLCRGKYFSFCTPLSRGTGLRWYWPKAKNCCMAINNWELILNTLFP